MNTVSKGVAMALAVALWTIVLSGAAFAQMNVSIELMGIRILDEDDPVSNDEPYIVNLGFRARITIGADGLPALVPNTLLVQRVGPDRAHNNLGRDGDNWAAEVNTYRITNQTYQTTVPSNEPGWIVGLVTVLFEEDAFSNAVALTMRDLIGTEVRNAIAALSFAAVDTNQITRAVAAKILRDINRMGSQLKIAGVLQSLAAAADPDDFGGVNMVLAITLPNNTMSMFAGPPPASVGALPALVNVPATGMTTFSLEYPVGALGSISSNKRYAGKCRIGGGIRRSG